MKKVVQGYLILGLGVALVSAGCSTVPDPYIPSQMGKCTNGQEIDGLTVTIDTEKDVARIGDILLFDIIIKNQGEHGFWLPRELEFRFQWVYPNGNRDFFLVDFTTSEYLKIRDVVFLKPGQQIKRHQEVKTYYFSKTGITEFQALMHVCMNTNPDLSPCWHGEILSNSYGVMIDTRQATFSGQLAGKPRSGKKPRI